MEQVLIFAIVGLFIALWCYAALPKLFNLKYFRQVLFSQAIPKWLAKLLSWLLPTIELLTVGLLIFPQTRFMGMCVSFLLMCSFTVYVSGIIFQVYEIYPCPCGGIFRGIGWRKHFKVNIILTLLALLGLVLMWI